jgi:hypothetical protein
MFSIVYVPEGRKKEGTDAGTTVNLVRVEGFWPTVDPEGY